MFVLEGHRLDTRPTLFVLPELNRAEFSALGEDVHALLDLLPVDPTHQVVFESGDVLHMTRDHVRMEAQLGALEAGSGLRCQRHDLTTTYTTCRSIPDSAPYPL